jgi:hypothetical protein
VACAASVERRRWLKHKVKTLGFTDPEVIATFAAAVGPTVG